MDTGPEAWTHYDTVLDRMDVPARLGVALERSDAVREVRLAGLSARHPGLSRREVIARPVAEDYGIELPPQR